MAFNYQMVTEKSIGVTRNCWVSQHGTLLTTCITFRFKTCMKLNWIKLEWQVLISQAMAMKDSLLFRSQVPSLKNPLQPKNPFSKMLYFQFLFQCICRGEAGLAQR